MISQLALSLDNDKAASLAQFFLDCCNRATQGEIVPDEDLLHHTIEREYLQDYGDVWRMLDAFTDWWEGYLEGAYQFPPAAISEAGGAHRITVETVVASFGMHPQLQQWNFEVSSEGEMRVLSVEPIYPKESRWLSYDFRSMIAPSIPGTAPLEPADQGADHSATPVTAASAECAEPWPTMKTATFADRLLRRANCSLRGLALWRVWDHPF